MGRPINGSQVSCSAGIIITAIRMIAGCGRIKKLPPTTATATAAGGQKPVWPNSSRESRPANYYYRLIRSRRRRRRRKARAPASSDKGEPIGELIGKRCAKIDHHTSARSTRLNLCGAREFSSAEKKVQIKIKFFAASRIEQD